MTPFKKNNDNYNETENGFEFSKAARGYNPKEVENFINDMKQNQKNVIKNYESKLADYKNTNEMLVCEIDELKATLAAAKANEAKAIAAADEARASIKKVQREILEIDSLKSTIEQLTAENEKLASQKDAAEKALKMAEVDKKTAKEKLESVKKELSDTRKSYEQRLENAQAEGDAAKQQGEEAAKSSSQADAELQRVVGAYTIHLKKTKQLVEALEEQIGKAETIF